MTDFSGGGVGAGFKPQQRTDDGKKKRWRDTGKLTGIKGPGAVAGGSKKKTADGASHHTSHVTRHTPHVMCHKSHGDTSNVLAGFAVRLS